MSLSSIYMEKAKLQAIPNNNCKTQLKNIEDGMWVNDLHLPMTRCKYALKSFFCTYVSAFAYLKVFIYVCKLFAHMCKARCMNKVLKFKSYVFENQRVLCPWEPVMLWYMTDSKVYFAMWIKAMFTWLSAGDFAYMSKNHWCVL